MQLWQDIRNQVRDTTLKNSRSWNNYIFRLTEMEEGRRGHEYSRAVLWNSKLHFDDDKRRSQML